MTLQDELALSKHPDPSLGMILSLLLTREVLGQVLEDRLFRPGAITDQQFNVLRILRGGPEMGYPLTEIRRRLIARNADVVRLVDRLTALGWVARGENPVDRRSSLVRLTEAGRAKVDGLADAHRQLVEALGQSLCERDRLALTRLLERWRTRLRRDFLEA